MKKSLYISFAFALLTAASCKKLDNYSEPNATLTGRVVDVNNKNISVQTEPGGGGTRIRLEEISWSDNPTPFYFNAMQDGTFNNTKLFPGTNLISVEGAFVPLVQYDDNGGIVVDNRKTVELTSGVTEVIFEVEPLLRVEWVGEPVINPDSTVTVQAVVTRGTNNPDFQADVSDVFFFLNTVPNVGNNNYDNRYSKKIEFSGTEGNDILSKTLTLTSDGKLPGKRPFWLRVGARTTYGLKQYNYTESKKIDIP